VFALAVGNEGDFTLARVEDSDHNVVGTACEKPVCEKGSKSINAAATKETVDEILASLPNLGSVVLRILLFNPSVGIGVGTSSERGGERG
jgi:hypothetical protein